MKFLVMVSLLVVVISCRADKAPRKTNTSQDQTSADLTVEPKATISREDFVDSSTIEHTVAIVAHNEVTEKFMWAFAVGENAKCEYRPNRQQQSFPKHNSEKKSQDILKFTDRNPRLGKRKLCVKGIAKDGRTQKTASTKEWKKIEPQREGYHPDITAKLFLDGDDTEVNDNKKVTGNVYIKVTKGSATTPPAHSTAEKFYYQIKNCGNEDENTCSCDNSPPTPPIPPSHVISFTNNGERTPTIDYPNPPRWMTACIYGLDRYDDPGAATVKQIDWKFIAKTTTTNEQPENERIQIKERPQNCSNQTTIELKSSAQENGKITQYKYRLYDGDHDCPTYDSTEYNNTLPYNLKNNKQISLGTPQDGEKTLCIIGLGDKDTNDNYNYIQQKPTKHQWFYQRQLTLEEGEAGITLDTTGPLEFVAGTTMPHTYIDTCIESDDQFEWELLVINDSRKAENIIQVKKTDTSDVDDNTPNDWHNLREHCSIPIVKGSLDAGAKQCLQFRLANIKKTDYGRPYFRTQELMIRRKGYAQSLRLAVNFKIPKLGMKFQTVTTNEAGIPRVILGPNRKSQTIEIVDISGNNLSVVQFPDVGFYWAKYPVFFKPRWLYHTHPVKDGKQIINALNVGLREEAKPWPDTTKTARLVIYSNGDSKYSDTGRRKYNTEYTWYREEDNGTKTKKTKRKMPTDSARNYIEVLFDPDL